MKKHITYQDAEKYILDIPKFSSKNSMEDTKAFLRFLGNPDQGMQIIHVAGTNGKGSVCAFLTSILCQAGCHVGTFISPHLVTMRERFLVDQMMISEEDFLEAFQIVKDKIAAYQEALLQTNTSAVRETLEEKAYHPSFFEYLFFMAMLIFQKKKIEYLILETGLGGRLDATNSVTEKLATVITSIGYDHMEYLGNSLGQIAGEKAGILRAHTPIIFSDKNGEVTAAILAVAGEVNAKPYGVKPEEYSVKSIFRAGIDFSVFSNYYGYICFHGNSAGVYQAENAALAVRTLEAIGLETLKTKKPITEELLKEGIANTFWEARMEQIMPGVFLDGAHNTDGITAFLKSVQYTSPEEKRILLYSVVKDKQYEEVLRMLADSKAFGQIGLVKLSDKRGLDVDTMCGILQGYDIPVHVYDSIEDAMENTLCIAQEENCVTYIAGSLYLAGEIKRWISDRT